MKTMAAIAVSAFLGLILFAWAQDSKELPREKINIPHSPAKLEMVKIPEGVFKTKDARVVKIKSIWMSTTEVTWDAYDPWRLMDDVPAEADKMKLRKVTRPSAPYANPDYDFGHEGYPAISVHFQSAQAYCKWLSEKTGHKYRLPTEEEWEYACRAGNGGTPTSEQVKQVAWVEENSEERTHPVGKLGANPWGLHDMLGNAAEWASNGQTGKGVLCGGSYKDPAATVSPSKREPNNPKVLQQRDPQLPQSEWWLSDGPHVGFRIVRED